MSEQLRNKLIPKGDAATLTAVAIIAAGIVGVFTGIEFSEFLLGAGVGFLFKGSK
jgi:hypothetical protein